MPLHSWLPAAHAAAPSHVSALMSGVVIKMGIYGLVRVTGLMAAPPLAWGLAILALGAVAAFFGVVFALAQHDLKRLLAFHSIENVGIILLGLGLALAGRATGRADWVLLGMAGCLFHVWNHALFKSLLFLGAGAVVHATGTRDLERMGGLARRMPTTAALFLVGAVAICGLPPRNGFASELVVYLGLARAAVAPGTAWAALAAPLLAATGALAVACFVKVVGVVFLGAPRSAAAEGAHEASRLMLAPMAALAAACALLGLAPGLVAPALERATAVWAGAPLAGQPLAALVPFGWVSAGALALVAAVALLVLALRPLCRRARLRQPELPTWDCGYAAASPRLQYTASSFAEIAHRASSPGPCGRTSNGPSSNASSPPAPPSARTSTIPSSTAFCCPRADSRWWRPPGSARCPRGSSSATFSTCCRSWSRCSSGPWSAERAADEGPVMALTLLVAAGILLAASGVPGLLLSWRSVWGPRAAAAGVLGAAALGIPGALLALGRDAAPLLLALPPGAAGLRPTLGVDALSACFALPLLVVGAAGSVYGLAYWPPTRHPRTGRRLRFAYGLLLAGMLFVTLARDAASFLIAWEVMALSGWFLVITETAAPGVRAAGWLYLLYSHAGTLAIAGFFAVLAQARGDFALAPLAPGALAPVSAFVAFGLALAGFGIKAGVMPLHVWLPGGARQRAEPRLRADVRACCSRWGSTGCCA